MPAEKRSGGKIETRVAKSLKKKFERRCEKLNVSVAQRLRDLVQKDLKQ
jgi:hypothetical protein